MRRNKISIKKVIRKKIDHNQTKPINVNMSNRRERRLGIQTKPINVDLVSTKKMIWDDEIDGDVDYDVVVIIASKDRFDNLSSILDNLFNTETKYSCKVIVINDASEDKTYNSLVEKYPLITYLENDVNYGKCRYWETINKLFDEAKKYKFKYLIQIDDDFELCNSFLDVVVDEYIKYKKINKKTICLSYHIMDDSNKKRWGLKYWIDGGGLYDYFFLKNIGFKINPINMNRWNVNKNISSGVWQQISKKINDYGCIIQKTEKSLANHLGFSESKMHPEFRKTSVIKTIKYE